MSRARQLTTKNLLETLKYYFDGMLPTQFAEKLLTNLQQGSLDVEKLNFAIFILEAFTPIEAKLELEGQVHRSVYLHWEATLKRRIRYIQNTNTPVLQYQHTLMSRTNQLSVDLACLCEPVLGKNRFQILCPTLESPVSKITLTNLNELALTDFVLSDRGSGFIEIEACLLSASSGDGVLRHTQLLEPEMVGEREVLRPRTLSDAEVQRVVLHNSHARALYEAIQTLQQLKNNQATVGGCLRTLIDGLSDGSSHRVSKFKSTKNGYAGDQALSAISSFTEVYEHLLPAIRAELNNMRCDHHDFLYYLNELGASYEHRREEVRVKAEAAVAALQELTNQDELLQQVTSYLAKQEKEAIERISISNDMLRGDKTLHVTKRASERLTELSKVTKSDDIKSKFIVLIRSWSESDREKILQEIGECVYLTGQGLEGLWKNNKARLYEMVIDGAPQGLARQVAEIEVRIKEYSEELSDYLRKLSHGEPYRPLWVPDNFNENEALLQAWFEQVEMTHFKQIMPVLLKYFRFAPRQLLKLKIAEFMSDNQLTWLIKQYPGLIYHLFEDALFDKSLEECDDDVKWHKLFLSCLVDTRELPAYRIGLARLLVLTDKIDINQPNVDGDTPFLSACVRMPRLALALIPLINTLTSQVNHNGKTALMCAAQSGDADLLQALIAKGASSNTKDVKGHDALNYAILNDRIEVVRLLLPTNDSLDVLKDACKNIYNEEIITCIYQHFAASGNEMKRAAGEMILQVACSINSKLINFIINKTDYRELDCMISSIGATPLVIFTRRFDITMVRQLIAAGAKSISEACEASQQLLLSLYYRSCSELSEADRVYHAQLEIFLYLSALLSPSQFFNPHQVVSFDAMKEACGVTDRRSAYKLVYATITQSMFTAVAKQKAVSTHMHHHIEVMTNEQRKWLIKHHFDVVFMPQFRGFDLVLAKARDWNKMLWRAVEKNRVDLVTILLQMPEVDCNIVDTVSGLTPLLNTVLTYSDREDGVFDLLVDHPATDLNARTRSGASALIILAGCHHANVSEARIKKMQQLKKRNARQDFPDSNVNDALMQAVISCSAPAIIELLLPPDDILQPMLWLSVLSRENKIGHSVLSEIYQSVDIPALKCLSTKYRTFNYNIPNPANMRTPLMEAAVRFDNQAVIDLLILGADARMRCAKDNKNALELASESNLLFEKTMTFLRVCTERGSGMSFGLVNWIQPDKESFHIFSCLAKSDSLESADIKQNTLLMLAASRGCLKHVEYLIDRGVCVSRINNEMKTAAELARLNGHMNISILIGIAVIRKYIENRRTEGSTKPGMFALAYDIDVKLSAAIAMRNLLDRAYQHQSGVSYLLEIAVEFTPIAAILKKGFLKRACISILGKEVFMEILQRAKPNKLILTLL